MFAQKLVVSTLLAVTFLFAPYAVADAEIGFGAPRPEQVKTPQQSAATTNSGSAEKCPTSLLQQSWSAYKARYLAPEGRIIDATSGGITTSEGQSYAMLRSVWMNDSETFDKTWTWTKSNLGDDHSLFAWKWGKRNDGTLGVMDKGNAADADEDIAFALLLASQKWNRPELRDEAQKIASSIWEQEVAVVRHRPYLTAGNWSPILPNPRLNPSYFAPYIYREFAVLDRQHDWNAVVDTSFAVLKESSAQSLLGLPPDWCTLNRTTGNIELSSDRSADFSYDAMRIPWRIAMDWNWNHDKRDQQMMDRFEFLINSWLDSKSICARYTRHGVATDRTESLAFLGAILPMMAIKQPQAVDGIEQRFASVYNQGLWKPDNDYYSQNWIWFGLAGAHGCLTEI